MVIPSEFVDVPLFPAWMGLFGASTTGERTHASIFACDSPSPRDHDRVLRHEVVGTRRWLIETEIDASVGVPRRRTLIEPVWNTTLGEVLTPEWTEVRGAWIPASVEYRVMGAAPSQGDHARLREALAAAGLDNDAARPGDPRFGDWERVRDACFPDGVPTNSGWPWQSARVSVLQVNEHADGAWCLLPEPPPERFYSRATGMCGRPFRCRGHARAGAPGR